MPHINWPVSYSLICIYCCGVCGDAISDVGMSSKGLESHLGISDPCWSLINSQPSFRHLRTIRAVWRCQLLTLESTARLRVISSAMGNLVVSIITADGQAPLGNGASAGTMMPTVRYINGTGIWRVNKMRLEQGGWHFANEAFERTSLKAKLGLCRNIHKCVTVIVPRHWHSFARTGRHATSSVNNDNCE